MYGGGWRWSWWWGGGWQHSVMGFQFSGNLIISWKKNGALIVIEASLEMY